MKPWMEITQYANNLVDQLKKRFPSMLFLNALKILDPRKTIVKHIYMEVSLF